jgi:uncharacterized protein YbjQ (UPF0145 family)
MEQNELNQQNGAIVSGLSGNELFCVDMLGFRPGNMVVGNSVWSLGLLRSFGTNIKTMVGGELTQITDIISQGRHKALERLEQEIAANNGHGATGMSSELIFHNGNIEFLSVASTLHRMDGAPTQVFSTAADGQELYCQMDAGYTPVSFAMGNVAYSIGAVRGITGMFKQMAKGEVHQYSDIFNKTRNLALERITADAQQKGANAVVGITTSILPFGETQVQEMLMIGTASRHELTDPELQSRVITSDLTAEELWNLARLGYTPLGLVLGTSVYSLGLVGGFMANLKNLVKGEISELTELIYSAREQSLKKVQAQASELGADQVLGVKTYIYDVGSGLIEFLAIGTAVKYTGQATTHSEQLIPQAIIRDKDTFINTADLAYGVTVNNANTNSSSSVQK